MRSKREKLEVEGEKIERQGEGKERCSDGEDGRKRDPTVERKRERERDGERRGSHIMGRLTKTLFATL